MAHADLYVIFALVVITICLRILYRLHRGDEFGKDPLGYLMVGEKQKLMNDGKNYAEKLLEKYEEGDNGELEKEKA